jgi:hypothetical protein
MPYIKEDRRNKILGGYDPLSEGELNFVITTAILAYLKDQGLSYKTINAIVGALESAKLEFYRRVAIPYEDKKIAENGDVYDEHV